MTFQQWKREARVTVQASGLGSLCACHALPVFLLSVALPLAPGA